MKFVAISRIDGTMGKQNKSRYQKFPDLLNQSVFVTKVYEVKMQRYRKPQTKTLFCDVWVQNFVRNFKGALWNFTQNLKLMHRKIFFLRGLKSLTIYYILDIAVTSYWAGESQITNLMNVYSTLYSDADQRNIKVPRHWPLCGDFTGEFPTRRDNNAENVSIWWRHHVKVNSLCDIPHHLL